MLRSPILQVRLPSSHIPRVLLTKTWEKSPGNRGIRLQKLSYLGKLQYFTDLKLTFCQMIHDDSHTFTMIPNFFHVRSRNGPVTRISSRAAQGHPQPRPEDAAQHQRCGANETPRRGVSVRQVQLGCCEGKGEIQGEGNGEKSWSSWG